MSNGSPFFHYGNKEGVLLELVRQMFAGQFRSAERLIGPDADPLLLYAAETAMQMHLAELSEPLRELYVTAYTLPSTSGSSTRACSPSWPPSSAASCPTPRSRTSGGWSLRRRASPGASWPSHARSSSPWNGSCGSTSPAASSCTTCRRSGTSRSSGQTIQMELTPIAEQIIDRTVRQADEAFEAAMATTTAQCP